MSTTSLRPSALRRSSVRSALLASAAMVVGLAGAQPAAANEVEARHAVHLPLAQRGEPDTIHLGLQPSATTVTVGRDLWLTVTIDGGNAIDQLSALVTYDPAHWLAVDEDPDDYGIDPLPGDWPPPGSGSRSCWADNGAGRMTCSLRRLIDGPRQGVVARLRLTAKAPGATRLTVTAPTFSPRRPMGSVRVVGEEVPLTISPRTEPTYTGCPALDGEQYARLGILGSPSAVPADRQPDINLGRRGAEPVEAFRGLVDLTGPSDSKAPQLGGLLAALGDRARIVGFSSARQLHDWNWSEDRPVGLLRHWPVTMAGVAAADGEALRVPPSGYDIGSGFEVLVLYAAPGRATLKYTREDNVVVGYTLHVEGVCIEPRLLALYDQSVREGRKRLPALRAGQAFGTLAGGEVRFVIRDAGQFMDPRSRKDWWLGYAR